MILLLAVFAILTILVLGVVLFPLVRKAAQQRPGGIDFDIVVYRRQLTELDEEISNGLLSPEQGDAARAEIQRRLLSASDAEMRGPSHAEKTFGRYTSFAAVAAIALIVSAGSAALYAMLGSPQMPGQPYAWRQQHDPAFIVASSASQLEGQLQKNPTIAGYEKLADMYFVAQNYDQAAAVQRKAVDLGANDATAWSALGEAVVMANGGAVVPEALAAFTSALTKDAHDERARFYSGLAEAQIGNLKRAVAIWRDLEKGADPGVNWLPMVREHIKAFAKQGNFDPASVPPSPPSVDAMRAAVAAMANTPPAQANAAPAAMSQPAAAGSSQDTMIRSMVAQLAARMEKNPDDVAGWQRLAHAYNVLGEEGQARAAIDHAVRIRPDDVGVQLSLAEVEQAEGAPGNDTPADFIATMRRVLKLDPQNAQALYYVGLAEQKAGHAEQARGMWNKALSVVSANDPLAISIRNRLDGTSGRENPH